MDDYTVREFCAWSRCKLESDTILFSIGVCPEHLERYFRECPDYGDKKWLVTKLKKEVKDYLKEQDNV
jgi:hypothetical protein